MKLAVPDRFFQLWCFLFLGLADLGVAYPLVYVISCSLSSPAAIAVGSVILWPVEFNLSSYLAVLNHTLLRSGFINSLFYVAGGTSVAVSLILLCAYPLSRKDLPDRKLFLLFFVITMFFSGGIIPSYHLMRRLGLVGSR
jgi:multiple sugar transport system permease protein/putative aldouronate transport system permease protein